MRSIKILVRIFEDFKKIISNCRLDLILTRCNTDIFHLKYTKKTNTTGAIKIIE